MFRTITARFVGTCQRCKGTIEVGQKIRYGGRGRTYHLKAQCENGSVAADADARETYARYGSQVWAETQGDNLGASEDY